MADFATALRGRLVANAQVTAAVGSKVYWNTAPQNTALPYIVLTVIDDPRPEHLKGLQSSRVTRIQVDCMASSYAAARAASDAVIAATATPATFGGVHFGRVKPEGPRDLGENVDGIGFIHRLSMDLLAEHKLA